MQEPKWHHSTVVNTHSRLGSVVILSHICCIHLCTVYHSTRKKCNQSNELSSKLNLMEASIRLLPSLANINTMLLGIKISI